jgi:hypothetical protein
MIRLTLLIPDEVYEQFRTGFQIGLFSFSFDKLSRYNITVDSVQHYCEDGKVND